MAQSINIDPLKIIASLGVGRARECDKTLIGMRPSKQSATDATKSDTVGDTATAGNPISHNVYYVKFYIKSSKPQTVQIVQRGATATP